MTDPILVRVSPEILERMKDGDVEPVVILGIDEQTDGTHDMTLRTAPPAERYRQALEAIRSELGVPGPDYPAPVANAVQIATEALNG